MSIKSLVEKVNNNKSVIVGGAVGAGTAVASCAPAWCASSFTADMFADLSTQVQSDIAILVPVGIGIMAIMIGVRLIPRIIYSFM